ncbi:MAG TPA: class I SAM-dependent methyltransferase [Pyrinomonadaceae bacterium]|nr:class I SAM-dependent methyltransferase [Pyrinomonadaceae bacterium]
MSSQKPARDKDDVEYRGLKIHAAPHLHSYCISRIKRIGLSQRAKVLEVGAGEGAFSQRLIDEGFDVTAVDSWDDRFRATAEFHHVDLNTDFPDKWTNQFDLVVAVEVIEHLRDSRHFISNCLKVLKPNGYLLLTSPNPENWLSRLKFLRTGYFLWFSELDYQRYGHITPIFSWQVVQICNELSAELVSIEHTDNAPLRRWLGDGGLRGLLTHKTFYLGALYPFMRGRRDGEVNIYLIRRQA